MYRFSPVYNGPSVVIRSSVCAVVAHFLYTFNDLLILYFTKNWCILMYNTRYYTWRQNFYNKIVQTFSATNSAKKCTITCCTFDKAICVYQTSGMSLLIASILNGGCKLYFSSVRQNQNTQKIQVFNKFYCATRCALCCSVLYSVVNFVV